MPPRPTHSGRGAASLVKAYSAHALKLPAFAAAPQEIVEHLRDEEKDRTDDLEESIRRHTEATAQREALLQQLQQQGITETVSDSPGLQGAGVQMAGASTAALAARMPCWHDLL